MTALVTVQLLPPPPPLPPPLQASAPPTAALTLEERASNYLASALLSWIHACQVSSIPVSPSMAVEAVELMARGGGAGGGAGE